MLYWRKITIKVQANKIYIKCNSIFYNNKNLSKNFYMKIKIFWILKILLVNMRIATSNNKIVLN